MLLLASHSSFDVLIEETDMRSPELVSCFILNHWDWRSYQGQYINDNTMVGECGTLTYDGALQKSPRTN